MADQTGRDLAIVADGQIDLTADAILFFDYSANQIMRMPETRLRDMIGFRRGLTADRTAKGATLTIADDGFLWYDTNLHQLFSWNGATLQWE